MEIIQVNVKADIAIDDNGASIFIPFKIEGVDSNTVLLRYVGDLDEQFKNLKHMQKIDVYIYSYNGIIVLSSSIKNIKGSQIIIDYPNEKKTIQRREYFRVNIQKPISVAYSNGSKDFCLDGKTVDLSGGGVRLITKEIIHAGFNSNFKLFIDDLQSSQGFIEGKAKILYSQKLDSRFASSVGYVSALKFFNLTPKAMQAIMKTCFQVQIELRKKGLV